MNFSLFLLFSELLGTIAFSVSGVLVAKKQKLDMFGAVVLGGCTAVGGGVLRDILLDITPPITFRRPIYAAASLVTALIVFFIERQYGLFEDSRTLGLALNAADTVGLGVFAVSGTNMAILSGHGSNAFLVIFVGVMTAVGGGILRDMLAGVIPVVMRKRIYAVAALLGAAAYYVLRREIGFPDYVSALASIGLVACIRFMAIRHLWNLPSFQEQNQRQL